MKVGLIREIKSKENRVGLTPDGVAMLTSNGHHVFVERGAGIGSGFSDRSYQKAGANIVDTDEAWEQELVVKVKEPIKTEYSYLRQQIIFTYFHLAGAPLELTESLLAGKTTAVAYETLEDENGRLPLLAPMSAVAGNMAVQMACHYLASYKGGKGVMLGSVLGKRHGEVLIIGDGVVGSHAARSAVGLGANVTVAGLYPENGERLRREISSEINYVISEPATIASYMRSADLVVGAVLLHGARTKHVVTEEMVRGMQPGSVIVDVSIDQGGCVETSQMTTHEDPVYVRHGIIHYCVGNMPGAFPRTSTVALTDATFPYVLKLANKGVAALTEDLGFAKAINTYQGYITCKPVADVYALPQRFRVFPGEFDDL
ncbi:MAG: alanine dehydrogenase [Gammaproteobacteria bacterium]